MGNTDSIPVISQAKSLTQFAFGDAAAARATQNNFIYNNTFPVLSQLGSLGYAIAGENDKALDLQKKFADDMQRIVDSIPVAGHIKGGVHYALGENEEGDEAMKAASRSTGVVAGGVGGFLAGGPVGAVAGGIAGGAAMDGIITGSEILINKDEAKPYGYVAAGKHIVDVVDKKANITVEQGFDIAMMPVGDGIAGYTAGRGIGKPLSNTMNQGKGKFSLFPPRGGSAYKPLLTVGDLEGAGAGAKMSPGGGAMGARAGAISAAGDAASAGKKLKPIATVVDDLVDVDGVPPPQANGNYLGETKKGIFVA